MIEWIKNYEHLKSVREQHKDFFILMFWGDFSEAAQRALREMEGLSEDYEKVAIYALDVKKVKDVHKHYGVSSVPTVVAVKNGDVIRRIEGVESARFYATQLLGAAPSHVAVPKKNKAPKVTVYTSPACPACGRLKDYLRKKGVSFRSIDISRDEKAAKDLVRRSGQRAVPQTDINGRLIVGFDQQKIDMLL